MPRLEIVAPAATVDIGGWRCGFLDTSDPAALEAYERRLYTAFTPALAINPLIRDLWEWDDASRRLRTRVPYASQCVAIMTDPATGTIPVSVGVNLDTGRWWQSGDYGFARPQPEDRACEFLILGNGTGGGFNGASAVRHFVFDFLFGALREMGCRQALATTADHMLWFYRRRLRAAVREQRIHAGHRRTLLHWDLEAPGQHSPPIAAVDPLPSAR